MKQFNSNIWEARKHEIFYKENDMYSPSFFVYSKFEPDEVPDEVLASVLVDKLNKYEREIDRLRELLAELHADNERFINQRRELLKLYNDPDFTFAEFEAELIRFLGV